MPVINNFADLKQVSKALKEEAKAREEAEKKRRAEEARRHAEANQFAAAMAEFGVRKMSQKKLATPRLRSPVPSPSISVRARTRNPSRRCRTFSTPPSFLKPKTAA